MKQVVLLSVAVLAALPGTLRARLGETPADCAKRYGAVVEDEPPHYLKGF